MRQAQRDVIRLRFRFIPACPHGAAGGPAEESATVKRIRITKPKARRERPGREPLPLDPRDLDIVRAKQLARQPAPTGR
jgi:hypothetical protein